MNTELNPKNHPLPGGKRYEELKSTPEAYQDTLELILKTLSDISDSLNWWKPETIDPVDRKDLSDDRCTIILMPTTHLESGMMWVFVGDKLQMSGEIEDHKLFEARIVEGLNKTQPFVEETPLIGIWFSFTEMLTSNKVHDDAQYEDLQNEGLQEEDPPFNPGPHFGGENPEQETDITEHETDMEEEDAWPQD